MFRRFLLVLALAGTTAHAADAARVAHYMEASGIDEAVQNAPMALVGGLVDSVSANVTPAQAQEFAAQNFDTAAMRKRIADRLAKELSDTEIDALAGFADSPFGKRVTALENATNSERPDLEAMLAATRPLFADQPRLLLTQRLDNAAGLTAFAVTVGIGAMTGGLMHAGRIPSDPKGFAEAAAAIDQQFRPTLYTQLQQQMMFSLLYTYRTLTADELKQYVEFLEQPASRHATTLVLDSLREDILRGVPPIVGALLRQQAPPTPQAPAAPAPAPAPR